MSWMLKNDGIVCAWRSHINLVLNNIREYVSFKLHIISNYLSRSVFSFLPPPLSLSLSQSIYAKQRIFVSSDLTVNGK